LSGLTRDAVCGREVDANAIDLVVRRLPNGAGETDPSAGTKRYHEGRWHYFCSLSCRQRFASDPEHYLNQTGNE
jgi:YHS domain-containing protein